MELKFFDDNKLYTSAEVSDVIKMTKPALYFYVKTGKLKAFRVGNSYRFLGADLNSFLKRLDNTAKNNKSDDVKDSEAVLV